MNQNKQKSDGSVTISIEEFDRLRNIEDTLKKVVMNDSFYIFAHNDGYYSDYKHYYIPSTDEVTNALVKRIQIAEKRADDAENELMKKSKKGFWK